MKDESKNAAINAALKRLDSVLPLVSGFKSLCSDDANLYCKLIRSYVQQGRTLTRQEVGEIVADAGQTLNNIVGSKLIVLDADGNPSGAYPFTSEEREHKVHINSVTTHCMCALDALAVSPMFKMPAVIDSQCRVTSQKVHIEQNGTELSGGTLDVWFGIDWGAAASNTVCAESLCMEMIFLASESVAHDWVAELPGRREIFDLPSAVGIAAGFFVPLAEYCRTTV